MARGAYVLLDADDGQPDVVLIGTGSEVQLAVAARDLLAADGVAARVVSMPCREWFLREDQKYRDEVLPPTVQARCRSKRQSPRAGASSSATPGGSISLEHFGASADYKTLFSEFGITAEAVATAAKESIAAAAG